MSYPDLDEARRRPLALREIFSRAGEDRSDRETLREVEEHCRAARAAVDDPACRDELAIIVEYAGELFSQRSHRKWESDSLSGAEFLRLQILKALDSFHSRLYSLEAIRRADHPASRREPAKKPGSERPL